MSDFTEYELELLAEISSLKAAPPLREGLSTAWLDGKEFMDTLGDYEMARCDHEELKECIRRLIAAASEEGR